MTTNPLTAGGSSSSSSSTSAGGSGGGGKARNVRILMVDDEPNILAGYKRRLRGEFTVVTANSGAEALAVIEKTLASGYAFPVIVSDMKMPEMDGAQFLGKARTLVPDAVQMLLSGQADLESTIEAVNAGNLFRFLTKPCEPDDLELALAAAYEQYLLVRAERDLLEQTLSGAVEVMVQVLAMASPEAFARTEQVRHVVSSMTKALKINDWRLPLAAMLSQIGCVAVPADVLHRARNGGELDDDETAVYLGHPQAARQLLGRIPRMEDVAEWIGDQPVRIPQTDVITTTSVPEQRAAAPAGAPASNGVSAGAIDAQMVLRAALDLLTSRDATSDPRGALSRLAASGNYPAPLMTALTRAATSLAAPSVLHYFTIDEIVVGMVLDMDVETLGGMVLVRKGEKVTELVAMRLVNFARTAGVKEPLRCWASPDLLRRRLEQAQPDPGPPGPVPA
jgi:CheY-like chemotaxis protein